MKPLQGKTIIVTGSSRGIGREIALRCAADGANLVIAAKSAEPHPKLPGTIYSVAKEVEAAGGKALPIVLDVRNEENVQEMVRKTVEDFGGIDALVNNAGAISLTATDQTPMKRYDLMQQVNARAVFLCSQACFPFLQKSKGAHIINLSPPISLDAKWLAGHVAYTMSKFGMTLCTIGMAAEFEAYNISVSSLWPRTLINTAAVQMLMGGAGEKHSRTPRIVADAAYAILCSDTKRYSGRAVLDEQVLGENGVKDFSGYSCVPGQELLPDLYV